MKIKFLGIISALLAVSMLSGCRLNAKQINENHNVPDESSEVAVVMPDEMSFFDTSDLSAVDSYRDYFAADYEFEDENERSASQLVTKFTSPDNETLIFDEQGRLHSYSFTPDENADYSGFQKFNENQLQRLASDVVLSYLKNTSSCLVDVDGKSGKYNLFIHDMNGFYATAEAEMNEYGQFLSLDIHHNYLASGYELGVFEDKLKNAVDSIGGVKDYSYTLKFRQVDKKIYALYDVDFISEDGSEFSRKLGFTMLITRADVG